MAITFAYELQFQHSIYQNRSEKNSDLSVPSLVGLKILEPPNSPPKFEFSPREVFFHIFHNLQKIPQAMSFTCLSSNFLWLLLWCS